MNERSMAAAIQRSALERQHEALGARWRSDSVRWAINFGHPERERAALAAGAVLIERGPIEKLMVSGRSVPALLRSAGLSHTAGVLSPARSPGEPETWGLASDEALVLSAGAELVSKLSGPGAASASYGSALTILRLAGSRAHDILKEACTADTGPSSLPNLRLIHCPIAGVRVTLAREDLPGAPAFSIATPRDYAAYLWTSLLTIGRSHGLTPAGTGLLEEVRT